VAGVVMEWRDRRSRLLAKLIQHSGIMALAIRRDSSRKGQRVKNQQIDSTKSEKNPPHGNCNNLCWSWIKCFSVIMPTSGRDELTFSKWSMDYVHDWIEYICRDLAVLDQLDVQWLRGNHKLYLRNTLASLLCELFHGAEWSWRCFLWIMMQWLAMHLMNLCALHL
jgi:hypothetical protein